MVFSLIRNVVPTPGMDFFFGLVFIAIIAFVLFSFFRSFSSFFSEMRSFQAMGKLGEGEAKEILEGENWEENLERARKRAERNGNTEKVEALEQVEEMGPVMDAMSGNVEDGETDEVADYFAGENTVSPTEDKDVSTSEDDDLRSEVEETRPTPEDIPSHCPQQYCDATWEKTGILGDGGEKYELLSNGQVRCMECGMITDVE